MEQAIFSFSLVGAPVSCKPFGTGHVNRTFLVETDAGRRYILQRINHYAFRDVPGLMENVTAICRFLSLRTSDPREYLHLAPVLGGGDYIKDKKGNYWRVFDYVENSVCLDAPETPEDFYQSAVAFGRFQRLLRDFPAVALHETIPNFHNTPDRYRIFHQVLEKDPRDRAKTAGPEIDFALAHEAEAGLLLARKEAGILPLRVTHNDTKLNNVMLDADTHRALCVIDLDTAMPGLAAYDFGDAIRFGASTGPEDEPDLSKISLDLDLYRIFTRGFVSACGGLTEAELESLPLGAKLMTLECGVRFLTDYLDGDPYFATDYAGHNLARARTQFKLVRDMEAKWDALCEIVREAAAEANG